MLITEKEKKLETATFAGGCFWCIAPPFEKLDGVITAVVGYSGGDEKNPIYEEVSRGETGHAEAIQIIYDPKKISYKELLTVFWRQIDPTDPDGSFVDRGNQYRSAIFYHNQEQKCLAEASKKELEESGVFDMPIVTEIVEFTAFYAAEDYHQDYPKKNAASYKLYRKNSGRDGFLERVWRGKTKKNNKYRKPADDELKKTLTPLQYEVVRRGGTERAFDNEFWDNKIEGIYVDIVSNEPLFSSLDKFDSGTGWPSFKKPLESENITEKEDRNFSMLRIEVRSKHGDSHLGHLFNDGPPPTGRRYCINSAALKFIPKEDLEKEGFGIYKKLFG